VPDHVARTHLVTGVHGGRWVNSYHAWAALEAPPEFEVTARCGPVVEAIAHRSEPITGIMWHPERAEPADPRDIALFTQLLGEVSCVP
jgi:putative glutamine amidotransferase